MTKEQFAKMYDNQQSKEFYKAMLTAFYMEDLIVISPNESGNSILINGRPCRLFGCDDNSLSVHEEDKILWIDKDGRGRTDPSSLEGETKAVRCVKPTSTWFFETEIPHCDFALYKGETMFCRAIVFHIDDLK